MTTPDYDTLFTKAAADLDDANERYRQAATDSMDAAFRGLVFGCAAEGVTHIELEPSDQGDYMSINELIGPDDEVNDRLTEDLWNFASDLTDYPDAPWRILPGVSIPEEFRSGRVDIDVKVAAEALFAATAPSRSWPTNDDEEQRFTDWQDAVKDRDTHLGFRDWLANEAD